MGFTFVATMPFAQCEPVTFPYFFLLFPTFPTFSYLFMLFHMFKPFRTRNKQEKVGTSRNKQGKVTGSHLPSCRQKGGRLAGHRETDHHASDSSYEVSPWVRREAYPKGGRLAGPIFTDFSDFLPSSTFFLPSQSTKCIIHQKPNFIFQCFHTFLGDFNLQKLPFRRLQGLQEQKNRVILEKYYISRLLTPLEVE